MKALLINDTGMTSNPGCRLVRRGYESLLGDNIANIFIGDSIPVHYWTGMYRNMGNAGRSSVVLESGCFPTYATCAKGVDFECWEDIRQSSLCIDPALIKKIEKSDCVIVNAEGSIHHNTASGLAVLALAKVGIELGKKVILANATIMSMEIKLLTDVLGGCGLIHVRDNASQLYLRELGLDSFLAPDIAFLGLHVEGKVNSVVKYDNSILITAGVAVRRETLEFLILKIKELNLIPVYLSIGDDASE